MTNNISFTKKRITLTFLLPFLVVIPMGLSACSGQSVTPQSLAEQRDEAIYEQTLAKEKLEKAEARLDQKILDTNNRIDALGNSMTTEEYTAAVDKVKELGEKRNKLLDELGTAEYWVSRANMSIRDLDKRIAEVEAYEAEQLAKKAAAEEEEEEEDGGGGGYGY